MTSWARDAFFYHLYPLRALGAPPRNTFAPERSDRLRSLHGWLDYLQDLGVDALLLGPVLQASTHGYDIVNYFRVDQRLGDEADLASLSGDLHRRNMRLVFDAVFHHTGREFPAFQDLLKKGTASKYRDWYHLDFSRRSPLGDPFQYEGWADHFELAKLNLRNAEVRRHLLDATTWWVERFNIDGLRLDAADSLEPDFIREISAHCRRLKVDLWLMGEAVRGDYRRLAHEGGLCSVTNYELYKALWSSHNDKNYFEIAYSLNRQFGPNGIYRGLDLYSFADNHDVDRVASKLVNPAHLYPLYILLITAPGVPSLYYGSEWGAMGRRSPTSDAALRPVMHIENVRHGAPHPDLNTVIKRLIAIRRRLPALRGGDYIGVHVNHQQFAFVRRGGPETVVIAVNSAGSQAALTVTLPGAPDGRLRDQLNEGDAYEIAGGACTFPLAPNWGRVLALDRSVAQAPR